MSYIDRNANIVLLFLVVISLTVLVGATVYYQQNFSAINGEYNEKLDNLKKMEKELQLKTTILNKTREELTLKAEREEEIGKQFTGIRSENEELASEKDKLSSQKESLETQLDDAQSSLREAQSDITFLKRKVAELEAQNSDLAVQVNYWKEQAAKYYADLQAAQGS